MITTFVGVTILVLTFSRKISTNSDAIENLKGKLKIKEELDKIWREIDKMKFGKKGGMDQTTVWVIVLIALIIIWLIKSGYLG